MSGRDPCGCGGGRGEEHLKQMAELSKNLTPRWVLTVTSPRRKSPFISPKLRKEMVASQEVPPGYDPVLDGKTKTKSVKRNERKTEKRPQAALEKGMISDVAAAGERIEMVDDPIHGSESVSSLAAQFDDLAVSANCADNNAPSAVIEGANSAGSCQDIDKRVRTLKKKIQFAEDKQQKSGKLEKLAKLGQELKILEDRT